MNIKIFVIGNKFDKFCYEGIKEYEKRLSRYGKFKLGQFKNLEQLTKKIPTKNPQNRYNYFNKSLFI